jgi:hypothetical protein
MDFIAVLIEGLISGFSAVGMGLAALYFLRKRLKVYALNGIDTYIGTLARAVQENPKHYADMLKPLIGTVVKEGAGEASKAVMPKFKLMDVAGMLLMQFLQGRMTPQGVAGQAAQKIVESLPG